MEHIVAIPISGGPETELRNVEVTAEDIRTGVRRDPRCCAVAVAIRRQLGMAAVVTGASVELEDGRCYGASTLQADWLWDFDEGRAVPPVVIELRPEDRKAGIQGELHRPGTVAPWRGKNRA
jgi:hypothetical protein